MPVALATVPRSALDDLLVPDAGGLPALLERSAGGVLRRVARLAGALGPVAPRQDRGALAVLGRHAEAADPADPATWRWAHGPLLRSWLAASDRPEVLVARAGQAVPLAAARAAGLTVPCRRGVVEAGDVADVLRSDPLLGDERLALVPGGGLGVDALGRCCRILRRPAHRLDHGPVVVRDDLPLVRLRLHGDGPPERARLGRTDDEAPGSPRYPAWWGGDAFDRPASWLRTTWPALWDELGWVLHVVVPFTPPEGWAATSFTVPGHTGVAWLQAGEATAVLEALVGEAARLRLRLLDEVTPLVDGAGPPGTVRRLEDLYAACLGAEALLRAAAWSLHPSLSPRARPGRRPPDPGDGAGRRAGGLPLPLGRRRRRRRLGCVGWLAPGRPWPCARVPAGPSLRAPPAGLLHVGGRRGRHPAVSSGRSAAVHGGSAPCRRGPP